MYIGKLGTQSNNLNITSINYSAQAKCQELYGKNQDEENTDVVTLSPAGKNQSMIKQLMNQKEFIQERKQSLLESGSESGSESMNDKLKEYDEQLEAIDEQIAQLQTNDVEDTETESDTDAETGYIYDKPKNKEEAQTEQLSKLTELSSGVSQAEVISSVKAHISGRISVLKSEIESSYGNIAQKIEDVGELQSRSDNLESQTAEKLGEINESAHASQITTTVSTVEESSKAQPEMNESSSTISFVEEENINAYTQSKEENISN